MNYSIVYSSKTGNTTALAEAAQAALPQKDCLYFGATAGAGADAAGADVVFAGFWTDKGVCDADTTAFLKALHGKQVFLFGTAGFGQSSAYFDKILDATGQSLSPDNKIAGRFMCQGKMPVSIRDRYAKMLAADPENKRFQLFLQNFDVALSHPDTDDLARCRAAVEQAARALGLLG